MTTSGKEPSLPANDVMPALHACEMSGNARIAGDNASPHGLAIRKIKPQDTVTFRYLHFDEENTLSVMLQSTKAVRVELYIDGSYYACLTTTPKEEYAADCTAIPPLCGKHTVEFKFFGDFTEASFSEFVFRKTL